MRELKQMIKSKPTDENIISSVKIMI